MTNKNVATKASKMLSSSKSTRAQKAVAGSALSQIVKGRTTSNGAKKHRAK